MQGTNRQRRFLRLVGGADVAIAAWYEEISDNGTAAIVLEHGIHLTENFIDNQSETQTQTDNRHKQ